MAHGPLLSSERSQNAPLNARSSSRASHGQDIGTLPDRGHVLEQDQQHLAVESTYDGVGGQARNSAESSRTLPPSGNKPSEISSNPPAGPSETAGPWILQPYLSYADQISRKYGEVWTVALFEHVLSRIKSAQVGGHARRNTSTTGMTFKIFKRCVARLSPHDFIIQANRKMFKRHRQAIKDADIRRTLRQQRFLQRQELQEIACNSRGKNAHRLGNKAEEIAGQDLDQQISKWTNDKEGSAIVDEETFGTLKDLVGAKYVSFYFVDTDDIGLLKARYTP